MSQKILITGAASAIAQATARLWAKEGASFMLVDINPERLSAVSQDLKVRGAKLVVAGALDLTEMDRHEELIQTAVAKLGGLDLAFLAHGTLSKHADAISNWKVAERELTTNFLSTASLLTHLANYFAKEGKGTIAAISSVAGDRGRQSNYVYASAKGGLSIFMEGLRNRLHPKGVAVVTIKPGFVDTPMTVDFKKGLLWVKPEIVAIGIHHAIAQKKDVAYVPWWWWGIMAIVKAIPEPIFKKMKL